MTLPEGEVHLWLATLAQPPPLLSKLAGTLSADERARAQRFRFVRDRDRFTAGRGILRTLIGRYLGIEPGQVAFAYGERGKPGLAPPAPGTALTTLRFNLSHSDDVALYAFARDREVGVDLERIRHLPNAEGMAAMVFSARERATLGDAPDAARDVLFFNGWTRKEAYVKAEGGGLSEGLDHIDVPLESCPPDRLLHIRGHQGIVSRWAMRALVPATGFAAAVVVEGEGWRLAYLQWLC